MNPSLVHHFMSHHGMSVSALAAKIGVDKNVLINKLNPARYNKLTDHEQQQILAVFQQLQRELAAFLDTDLNELPAALTKQATAQRDGVPEPIRANAFMLKNQHVNVMAPTPIARVPIVRARTKGLKPEQQPLDKFQAADLQTVSAAPTAPEKVPVATGPASALKPVAAKQSLRERVEEILLGYEDVTKVKKPAPVGQVAFAQSFEDAKRQATAAKAKATRQRNIERTQRNLKDPLWLEDHPYSIRDASEETLNQYPHLRDLIPPPPSAEDYAKTLALFRK